VSIGAQIPGFEFSVKLIVSDFTVNPGHTYHEYKKAFSDFRYTHKYKNMISKPFKG